MGIKGKKRQQQRRQQLQQLNADELPNAESAHISPDFPSASSSSSSSQSPSSSTTSIASEEMSLPVVRNILLCAIGNPGSLLTTRHSAAHILLPHLSTTGALSTSRTHGGPSGPGPSGDTYTTTLFQSTSFMNVSGPAVSKAWKAHKSSNSNPVLVILHDELEKAVGKVKYKKDGSAGGHNGLTSIKSSVQNETVHKIGLGIGRPESRDKNVVADYVLQRMPSREKDLMVEEALPLVLRMLEDIGSGKLK
ncbi:hypothetical protein ABW20_dc0102287 [Dactylellina cionopaga]|nr:hypothetical protein ABW20_dc0102287 [Dactylellina cionopaga]